MALFCKMAGAPCEMLCFLNFEWELRSGLDCVALWWEAEQELLWVFLCLQFWFIWIGGKKKTDGKGYLNSNSCSFLTPLEGDNQKQWVCLGFFRNLLIDGPYRRSKNFNAKSSEHFVQLKRLSILGRISSSKRQKRKKSPNC